MTGRRDVLDRGEITEKLGLRTATARKSRYWRLIPQITEGGLRTNSADDWRQINVRSRGDQVLGVWTTMGTSPRNGVTRTSESTTTVTMAPTTNRAWFSAHSSRAV